MARITRKSDGRRIFTDDFKRQQIGRVWRGELTLAELSRKLRIARSLLQRWKRLMPQVTEASRAISPRKASPSEQRASQHIRELQLMVGRQTVGLELLRMELDAIEKARNARKASKARNARNASKALNARKAS